MAVELPPNVRLNLTSAPENVVLIREMLSGVAEAVRLDGSNLNDIKTAVTEACNNVVLHAYAGKQGPMLVEVCVDPETLTVLVRDHGSGIQLHPPSAGTAMSGIGLHVMQTLCDRVEFTDVSGGGSEVRMQFATPGRGLLEPMSGDSPKLPPLPFAASPTTTMLSIEPISLARTVLPRLVSTLAARAHFSTDRISDAQLLADALVAHAHGAIGSDHLSVELSVEPRDLELRIAPLEEGMAQRLIGESKLEGFGRVIEKLADRHKVASGGAYETLTLGLVDRH